MRAILDNNKIVLKFKYDPSLIHIIKSLPIRKYNPENKTWVIPNTKENRTLIKDLGFRIEGGKKQVDIKIPGLRKYQLTGVKWLVERDGRGLLADEMGLGKTVQSIKFAELKKTYPTIVICPNHLKLNWEEEIKKWTDKKVHIIRGTKPYELPKTHFYIINYEIVQFWAKEIIKIKPELVIIDEAHYIKNPKAKRTISVRAIAKRCKRVVGLTGTPIENRPIEIFNILNILEPSLFPSRWKFAERYCGLRFNGFGWDMTGSSNEQELNSILSQTVMLRRKKVDVLKELPEKQRIFIPIEPEDLTLYNEILNKIKTQSVSFSEISKMRHLLGQMKVNATINFVNDIPEQVVTFTYHRNTAEQIHEKVSDSVLLYGGMSEREREHALKLFKKKNKRVLIASINVASTGLNLQNASKVVFSELVWNPVIHLQAEDRVHRMGQKNNVEVYYLVVKDTVDEYVAKLLAKKMQVISRIIDGNEDNDLTNEIYQAIIQGKVK